MKARINIIGQVELTPENEAEHAILQYTEYETVEVDLEEPVSEEGNLNSILNVAVDKITNNVVIEHHFTEGCPLGDKDKSIYPDGIWDNVEDHYQYIATDKDNDTFFYGNKPSVNSGDDFWSQNGGGLRKASFGPIGAFYWMDSLEARPE